MTVQVVAAVLGGAMVGAAVTVWALWGWIDRRQAAAERELLESWSSLAFEAERLRVARGDVAALAARVETQAANVNARIAEFVLD